MSPEQILLDSEFEGGNNPPANDPEQLKEENMLRDSSDSIGKNSLSPIPDRKITLYAEIPSQKIKKTVRLLPNKTLTDFITKLQRKRILGELNCGLILTHLKGGTMSESKQLPPANSKLNLWELGVRDGDWIVIMFDLLGFCLLDEASLENSSKKKDSLLDRFRSAATKTLRGSVRGIHDNSSVPTINDGPTSLGLLFGVPLEIVADMGPPLMSSLNFGVPSFVESAFKFLCDFESTTEGIFRLSGSIVQMKNYKAILDKGEQVHWEIGKDAHNVTGLIKMYLRELPEPLLTFTSTETFCRIAMCSDEGSKLSLFKALLYTLPKCHFNLLKFVIQRIEHLSMYEGQTKMGISNLATLIGPNLGWPKQLVTDQQEMFIHTSKMTSVATYLLNHHLDLFDETGENEYNMIVKVTFDHQNGGEDELKLTQDDLVFVSESDEDDGWWTGVSIEKNGYIRYGKFPSNYVQVLQRLSVNSTCISRTSSEIKLDSSGTISDASLKSNNTQSEELSVLDSRSQRSMPDTTWVEMEKRIASLESELSNLKLIMEEERQQRIKLFEVIPNLMSNQDQVLALLQKLNSGSENINLENHHHHDQQQQQQTNEGQ